MKDRELLERVKFLVGQNKITEALNELEANNIAVELLKARLLRLNDKIVARTESAEYYEIHQNRLAEDILAVAGKSDSKSTKSRTTLLIGLFMIALLISVSYALINWLNEGTALQEKTSLTIIGKVVGSHQPFPPISNVTVTIDEGDSPTSSFTDKNGAFILKSDMEDSAESILRLSHEHYKSYSTILRPTLGEDTIMLGNVIRLDSIVSPAVIQEEKNVNTIPKKAEASLAISFRGESWKDCALLKKFKDASLKSSVTRSAKYTIDFTFDALAIRKNSSGEYNYNKAFPPIVNVNGITCEECSVNLSSPPWPGTKSEIEDFLKKNIEVKFQSQPLLDRILSKL